MPEVDLTIGGRPFRVACQDGEEPFLEAAARALDTEASAIVAQAGRIPETRMLLMAGLMVADRLAGLEERLRTAEERLRLQEARPTPEPQRIEVPVVPREVVERLAEYAALAEALASQLEERSGI